MIRPWSYAAIAAFFTTIKARGVLPRGAMAQAKAECKTYEAHPESTPTAHEVSEWTGGDGSFLFRTWLGETTESEFMDWWYDARKSGVSESMAQYLRYIVGRHGSAGLRETPRCYVGTCHSFKGSEAGVVYVFPDLSPTAHTHWNKYGSEEKAEIVRQFYVAMTRSQEGLVICRNASSQCAPLRREVLNYLSEAS